MTIYRSKNSFDDQNLYTEPENPKTGKVRFLISDAAHKNYSKILKKVLKLNKFFAFFIPYSKLNIKYF
jgi:hypothetical protein